MRRQAGFSLQELMVVVVLIGMIFGGSFSVLETLYRGQREAQGQVEDLRVMAQALEVLEADLRKTRALRVLRPGGHWMLSGSGPDVFVRLNAGVLVRSVGSSERVLARRVASLELREAEACFELALSLQPRRHPARPPRLFAAVAVAEAEK